MGNYTIFLKFENPRRGRQARNLSENDPKILDLKSSSEQIIFRKLSLGAPAEIRLFFVFLLLCFFGPRGKKNNALLPKEDYRDKGKGMIAG